MVKRNVGILLVVVGVILLVSSVTLQIVAMDLGDFYINGAKLTDQQTYSLKTRTLEISYIEAALPTGQNLVSNPSVELDSDSDGVPDDYFFGLGPHYAQPTGEVTMDTTTSFEGSTSVKLLMTSIHPNSTWGTVTCQARIDKNLAKPTTTYKFRLAYKCDDTGYVALVARCGGPAPDYAMYMDYSLSLDKSLTWKRTDWLTFTTPSEPNWTATTSFIVYARLYTVGTAWVDSYEVYEAGASEVLVQNVRAMIKDSLGNTLKTLTLTQQSPDWTAAYTLPSDGTYTLLGYVTADGDEYHTLSIALNVDTTGPTSPTTEPIVPEEQPTTEPTPLLPPSESYVKKEVEPTLGFIGVACIGVGCAVIVIAKRRTPK